MKNVRKRLIVNADDCNLTRGVTRAVIRAHRQGIVTSTTFLINLPVHDADIRTLKRLPNLGIGLHLNITLGRPVSPVSTIPGLIEDGLFHKRSFYRSHKPAAAQIYREYEAQIKKFKKVFGWLPTHLDTHHQLHDEFFFMKIISRLARSWKLPVRRSILMNAKRPVPGLALKSLKTTHLLVGNLDPAMHWRRTSLLKVLKSLPAGLIEIMCHPGYNDRALDRITSFTAGREAELHALTDPVMKSRIKTLGIDLTHYGLCYT